MLFALFAVGACSTESAPAVIDDALPERVEAHLAGLTDLPNGMTAELVRDGARIFHLAPGTCHVCHGEDGRGARNVGPDLADGEWWNSEGTWRGIERTILAGVGEEESHNVWGAAMPVRGGADLDDSDVRAVAAYVWTLRLAENTN